MISESRSREDLLYFHGSKEAKQSSIKAPSCRHPFYVTSDLHYAMAFCSKNYSSTGDWKEGKKFSSNVNDNYCYLVTLKNNANFFDFRNQSSSEFKKFFDIVPQKVFEFIQKINATTDIYSFIVDLETYVIDRLNAIYHQEKGHDYLSSVEYYEDPGYSDYLSYVEYYEDPGYSGKDHRLMDRPTYLEAVEMIKRLKLTTDIDSPHERLEVIFDQLRLMHFQGIITSEEDVNNDVDLGNGKSGQVTTDYAIGIWDKDALDLMCITPMKYKWLKKINPEYVDSRTSDNAIQKIYRYKQLYGKITKNA